MNTHEIKAALRIRYEKKAYALLWEVGNGTGMNCNRHADAVAMSLWPSRGLELIGFEIKASRTDWQKELSQPQKAEAVYKFCDRWFLVAGDEKIVRDGELPPTWGLIVPRGAGLGIKVDAPKLTPLPVDRSFLAALLRRVDEQCVDNEIIKRTKEEGYSQGQQWAAQRSAEVVKTLESLQKCVNDFESASGVRINSRWDYHEGEKIGHAVRAILDGSHKQSENQLRRICESAKRILAEGEACIASLREEMVAT